MLRKYGFAGSLRLMLNLIRTKLFYPSARLIRFPFEIRNKRFIALGKQLTTGVGCRLEALPQSKITTACIQIGNNVQLNDYVHIGAILRVVIGDDVLIASKVFITDHNHGYFSGSAMESELHLPPIHRKLNAKPVKIGNKCWLGENVIILPGVEIGEGSIVGAGAIVTKSFPAYSVLIGSPARLYKRFNFETEKWELL